MIYKYDKTTGVLSDLQAYLIEWASKTMSEKMEDDDVTHPLVLKYSLSDIFAKAKQRTAFMMRTMKDDAGNSRFDHRLTDGEQDLFEEGLFTSGNEISMSHLSPYARSYMNSYQFRIKDGVIALTGQAVSDIQQGDGFSFLHGVYTVDEAYQESSLEGTLDNLVGLDLKMFYPHGIFNTSVAGILFENPTTIETIIEINDPLPQEPNGLTFEVWDGDSETEFLSFNIDLPRLFDLNLINQLDDAVEKYLVSSGITLTYEAMAIDDLVQKELARLEGYDEQIRRILNKRTHGFERRSRIF